MIGLFDSGLGGLTVLRRLRTVLPQADVIYFADQAHVPYGDRSETDLIDLVHSNLAYLDRRGVHAVAMACNTSCAIADRYGWPAVNARVLDLIDSAAQAVERIGLQRIGVIATAATVRSEAYARHIVRRVPTARVVQIAAPALVPLVEAGQIEGDIPGQAVREVCALLPADVEAVILACTHYPLLDDHFAAVLGPGVTRLDPAVVQAERAAGMMRDLGLESEGGTLECVTSGDVDRFEKSLKLLLPDFAPRVRGMGEAYETISKASAVPEI